MHPARILSHVRRWAMRGALTTVALFVLMALTFGATGVTPVYAIGGSQTYTTAGTFQWTAPPGVTSVTVEVWGGGGKGEDRIGGSYTSGGGGGGGGYSKLNSYTVIPGNNYTVTVGAGSTSGSTPGGSSYFVDTSTVLAYGGRSVPAQGGYGAAGAPAGVGDITRTGGNGIKGAAGYCGGGGGSSAGTGANGTNATGNAGAVAPTGGGNGGAGKGCNSTGNGSPGSAPGGGGGGGVKWSSGSGGGGAGGAGKVVITWNYATTTSVSCTPNPVTFGSNSSCTATVTRSAGTSTPTGTITWTRSGGDSGSFSAGTCALSGSGASASCSVTYTPSAIGDGSHGITATFGGNANFNASSGSQELIVELLCNAANNGIWNNVATWDCGMVPVAGSIVKITGKTVTLDVDTADLKDFTIGSGGTLQNNGVAHTVSLTGDWSNSGTFTPGTFIGVTFDGTGAQTLTGSTTFQNLTINNTGGGVTFANNMTVNGTLTLNSDLTTSSSVLILASGATVAGAKDVVGTVRRSSFSGAQQYNNQYTMLNFVTAPSQMDVVLQKSAPSGFSNAVTRQYTLTPTGSVNATVQLAYQSGELNGNTEANLKLWRYDSTVSKWVLQGGTVDAMNHHVSVTGVTEFSPWAISGNGNGPTAVSLSSFKAESPSFDLGAWLRGILGR